MKTFPELLACVWKADAFSPTAFVVRAIIIAVLFCVSELLGLREYTTFLSGASANLNVSWQTAVTLGLVHLLLYLAFIQITGWDGFVTDNQFSSNGSHGFACDSVGATVMFTANRVEWNNELWVAPRVRPKTLRNTSPSPEIHVFSVCGHVGRPPGAWSIELTYLAAASQRGRSRSRQRSNAISLSGRSLDLEQSQQHPSGLTLTPRIPSQ